jgi:hypothetical protein
MKEYIHICRPGGNGPVDQAMARPMLRQFLETSPSIWEAYMNIQLVNTYTTKYHKSHYS